MDDFEENMADPDFVAWLIGVYDEMPLEEQDDFCGPYDEDF